MAIVNREDQGGAGDDELFICDGAAHCVQYVSDSTDHGKLSEGYIETMRVLHASASQFKHPGARNYLHPNRIHNGLIRNNHDVLWFSDRDMARFSSWFKSRKTGVAGANRKFLEVCANFQPDVIALCSQDVLRPETIAQARKKLPNVAIFQYFIDPLFIEHNVEHARAKAEVVDWTFVTTAGPILSCLAGTGSKVAFVPNPVDTSIDVHRCHERTDQPFDVFFAGSAHNSLDPDDLRVRAHELLRRDLPQARCAIHGQGQPLPLLYGTPFLQALGQAKIGLNFSQRSAGASIGPGGPLYLYSSDRIGIYQGNGLLVFTTRSFQLSDLYGKDSIVEVDGADDFIEKMRFYIDHESERQRVAKNGWELGHREFNERLVAQYMVESALGMTHSHRYAWPTTTYSR
jgi:hypothetical protein